MLFEKRFWAGIADGSVTATFRRWKGPQATAGRTNRTPAGLVNVTAVDVIVESEITDLDAIAAGFADAPSLIADLRGDPANGIYRVRFQLADSDPRADLAATPDMDEVELGALAKRLARLDAASSNGPWTLTTLRLIAANPATRAGDLCGMAGREMPPFKLDVRKLKNLGLTISLGTGYRLSPRGQAYLESVTVPRLTRRGDNSLHPCSRE